MVVFDGIKRNAWQPWHLLAQSLAHVLVYVVAQLLVQLLVHVLSYVFPSSEP